MTYSELKNKQNQKLVEIAKQIGQPDNWTVFSLAEELVEISREIEEVESKGRCPACGHYGLSCSCWNFEGEGDGRDENHIAGIPEYYYWD